ncbi:MAG TPA: kelch repeat-containing protein [Thermomicrobiales bacterium]|jgi:N-acetylneuraminic acid mutarotase
MLPRRLIVLLLLGLLLAPLAVVPPIARANAPVVSGAALGTPRAEHTATRLLNGQVLVVGGYTGRWDATSPQTLATTERYDPLLDRWRPAAPLAAPRQAHTATPLADGRVLVVGGHTPGATEPQAVAAAELYDPVADRWTATGSLRATRWLHQAVALADGRVMVVGGREHVYGLSYGTVATTEIFDPATGRWTVARPMGEPRFGHTATTLRDGRVLVVGGRSADNSHNLATAEIYDPADDRWQSIAFTPTGAGVDAATLLPSGEVLITGDAQAARYDPVLDRWYPAGNSQAAYRFGTTATLLPDGKVLVVGGVGGKAGVDAERYDPITEEWRAVDGLPSDWRRHTATLLADGRVLIAGGITEGNQPASPQTWLFTDDAPGRCFAETAACISGQFLAYWEEHGGLARNGFPLGPVRSETLEDGRAYRVQYFERVRLEYHPEQAGTPYAVQLGQFGRRLHPADPPVPPLPGVPYDDVTGHNIARPAFAAFYAANGGLAQFGRPLSEELVEMLEDGQPYTVQYFERARLEYHPENPAPYDVLLGQFGRRILAASTVEPPYRVSAYVSDTAPQQGDLVALNVDVADRQRPLGGYQIEAVWHFAAGARTCTATAELPGHASCAMIVNVPWPNQTVQITATIILPDGTRLNSLAALTAR